MVDSIGLGLGPLAQNSKNQAQAAKNQSATAANGSAKGQAAADVNVKLSGQSPADRFDGEQVQKVVLANVKRALDQAQSRGASEQELDRIKEQALRGAAKGFGEAKDIIKGLGRMTDELAEKIDASLLGLQKAIKEDDYSLVSAKQEVQARPEGQLYSQGYYRTNQAVNLQLKTASGKTLEINISQNQEILHDLREKGGLSLGQWQMKSAGAISFVVNGGELSEREKKAIGELVANVGKIADQFFNGSLDKAYEMAKELSLDDDQLVSMSLNMRQETTKAMAAYQQPGSSMASLPKGLQPISDFVQQLEDVRQQALENQIVPSVELLKGLFELHPEASESRMAMLDKLAEALQAWHELRE